MKSDLNMLEALADSTLSSYGGKTQVESSVPEKYKGTAVDRHDMVELGKKQVLRRNFKFLAMLGFASTVMVGWEIENVIIAFTLIDGGTPVVFWGLVVGAIGMSIVYASIAEMASMCPTAGGQYHWVSEFAPPRIQKELSYTVGWLCAIGWQVYLAGVCFMVGSVIQGLIKLNNPGYVWHNYHATLLAIAVICFSIIFNTVLAVRLPLIEAIVLILHVAGVFVIIIPLWVMSPRGHAHETLLDFTDDGGWGSTGLSTMIGLCSPVTLLIGFDCSVHMSEEVQDASAVLPKAIMWSVVPNALLNILMGVTLIFCLGDLASILNTDTNQPFIQIFFNATQSVAATNVMTAVVAVLLTSACISQVATASRQIWSFARDGGLPASAWLAAVSPGWNIPLRAVSISLVISSLIALINIGSTDVINAINSLGSVAILISYFITISCLVWRRLCGAPLPARRWSLGRWGLAVNIISLVFIAPILFFDVWPLVTPLTAGNMNWSSVMLGSVLIIALVYYLVRGRKEYTGPVVLVKRN